MFKVSKKKRSNLQSRRKWNGKDRKCIARRALCSQGKRIFLKTQGGTTASCEGDLQLQPECTSWGPLHAAKGKVNSWKRQLIRCPRNCAGDLANSVLCLLPQTHLASPTMNPRLRAVAAVSMTLSMSTFCAMVVIFSREWRRGRRELRSPGRNEQALREGLRGHQILWDKRGGPWVWKVQVEKGCVELMDGSAFEMSVCGLSSCYHCPDTIVTQLLTLC